jgi:TRAP-type uncharacterized transport system substrate-binding protein
MAISTSFYGAKLEPLFIKYCSSSSSSSIYYVTTHLSFFGRNKKSLVRCEASSDNANSVSALQQLKTSAADSKFSLNLL